MKSLRSALVASAGIVLVGASLLALPQSDVRGQVPSYAQPPLQRNTFRAIVPAMQVPQTGAGDISCITGSATAGKPVRVKRIVLSGTDTTAQTSNIQLIKRSAADTGGTAITAPTVVPLNTAATATPVGAVAAWTAIPTPGAAVGPIDAASIPFVASATVPNIPYTWEFNVTLLKQEVVLNTTAQSLCINAPGAFTTAGPIVNITWEWTE